MFLFFLCVKEKQQSCAFLQALLKRRNISSFMPNVLDICFHTLHNVCGFETGFLNNIYDMH